MNVISDNTEEKPKKRTIKRKNKKKVDTKDVKNTVEPVNNNCEIKNMEGVEYLNTLDDKSIHLILTDPPYIISKNSGMNNFSKKVKKIEASDKNLKTETDWNKFKKKRIDILKTNLKSKTIVQAEYDKELLRFDNKKLKQNFLKYGNISGKKFGYKTDYGQWDKDFSIDKLEKFIELFYKKLRKGGTCIIFFDLWKIEGVFWVGKSPCGSSRGRTELKNYRYVA